MQHNLAIIQARMSSSRLPGKVMYPLSSLTVLEYMYQRVKQSKQIDGIIFATSTDESDDRLIDFFDFKGMSYYRGPLNDVLARYYRCSKEYIHLNSLEESNLNIIRLTGDCPLIDYRVIDHILESYMASNVDYCSNTLIPTYPDGMDTEIFSFSTLTAAYHDATLSSEREHVTPFIKKNATFKKRNVEATADFSHIRLTLDEASDYDLLKRITKYYTSTIDYSYLDVISLLTKNPQWMKINSQLKRDEGLANSIKNDCTLE
mgnify:CR=1 FL=1